MEYRTLGKTDLRVSRVSMGAMTFGKQVGEQEAVRMVDCCLELGINSFDTANIYAGGQSEAILGHALRGRRHQVVLATKVGVKAGDGPDDLGLSRPAIRKAINASLRRLGTDYIDLYCLHLPDCNTRIEETLRVMDELVQEGKVRSPAVSNYAAWQIVQMLWHCENHGYAAPTVAQQMYSLVTRGIEDEYLACSKEMGLGLVIYSPLAGGLLSGKHLPDKSTVAGTRFDGNQLYLDRYWHPAFFDAVREIQEIARAAGSSMVELAFRWLMSQPHVDSVILGATSLAHLQENASACLGPPLDPETLARCDAVWRRLRGVTPRYNR